MALTTFIDRLCRVWFAGLSDEEIMVQALIFALVGNGNMAYLVAFTAYNLAVHPQTQTRLQAEIDRTFPGKVSPNCRLTIAFSVQILTVGQITSVQFALQCPITYEELLQMKYPDMVVTETSRLYPLGNRIERVAKSTVEVSGVPIYTLHRDPTVWPDPDSFKPERYRTSRQAPPTFCQLFKLLGLFLGSAKTTETTLILTGS